jgi:cytochrome c
MEAAVNRPDLRATVFSALSLLASLAPVAAAPEESDEGQVAYNNACRTCHSFKPGDNRLGPSLHGVVGRKAGTLEGFAFSPAMKGSGITWDEAALDKFISNPNQVVSGNKIQPFGGVADASERTKIVNYLKTLK